MPKHQTTRERVYKTVCAGGWEREHSCPHSPSPPVPKQNPGAGRAKELKRIRLPPAPVSACGGRSILVVLFTTTLGNGYLGSRIDEERSEMRYLV